MSTRDAFSCRPCTSDLCDECYARRLSAREAPDDAAVGQFFRLLRKNELADAQQMAAACPGLLAATYQEDYGPLSYVCCQLSFGNPSGYDYLALATWLMEAGADPNLRANDGCLTAPLAVGGEAIKCPSTLNVLKDTYDQSCC